MRVQIKNVIIITLLAFITLGGMISCNNEKKLAKKEYAAKLEQAKIDLNDILNDETQWTLDQQKARVEEIKKADFQDPEITELIERVEAKLEHETNELERIAEEKKLREQEQQNKPKTTLENYFTIIAGAPSSETANVKITEVLKQFASPDVPVIIIIYHVGDIIDYDTPTTIEKYLNYLKDQKVVNVHVNNIKYDDNGKITELELIKK